MIKPALTIIKSPEAERMRRMVTEGFYDRSRIGLWMFEVIGREYDDMADWARTLHLEAFPQTCTWSIPIWEFVYGFDTDDTLPLEYRRQRILAKRLQRPPTNPARIEAFLSALTGCPVSVTENCAPYTFRVDIDESGGKIYDYRAAFRTLREIKPSHLSVLFRLVFSGFQLPNVCRNSVRGIHRATFTDENNITVPTSGFRIGLYPNIVTPILYDGTYRYDGAVTWAGFRDSPPYQLPARSISRISGLNNHAARVRPIRNTAPLLNAHKIGGGTKHKAALHNTLAEDAGARLTAAGNITYSGAFNYDGTAYWDGRTANYKL